MSNKESHLRSVIKGFTWRIIASTTILIITFFTTGHWETAFTVAGIEFVIKIFLYYLHERAWLMVPVGTVRKIFRIKK